VVLFNYAIREVTAKLVYYGPGLCGKTTNLQFIHEKLDPSARGKLLSLATDGDRTLFFDFLPIEMGSIGGYKVRFQLYTVPGQVHYNATRKLVLKGVDAVAFVADSQLSMVERNRESFQNLIENLIENGYDPAKIPIVIQLNKRDLPNVASVGDLVAVMGVEGYPVCEAVASRGDGVFETLKTIVKLTLSRLRNQFDAGGSVGGTERRETPPPPPPPPSVVFAPAPAPPPPQEAEASAVPVAPAPQPLVVEAEVPAVPIDGLDEFDLEYFSDEKAGPVAAGSPEVAPGEEFPEEGVVDLEADMETLMDGRRVVGEEVPDTPGTIDVEDVGEARVEDVMAVEDEWPVETSPFAAVAPPAETFTHEPPPWAVEMREELQRLRTENSVLRDALRGITTLLDRQIGVLQDGRDELDRHVGGIPGESEP
jgi:signal recognition particle receptor subunit beta